MPRVYPIKSLNSGCYLAHAPTFRLNLQIEAPHLLKGAAHQVIAVATAAEREGPAMR